MNRITLALAVVALAGCAADPASDAKAAPHRVGIALNTVVDKISDEENGVVCYVAKNSAISCVKVR